MGTISPCVGSFNMFMIYGLALMNDDALETGEKCIQDSERAKRASRFLKYLR